MVEGRGKLEVVKEDGENGMVAENFMFLDFSRVVECSLVVVELDDRTVMYVRVY